MSEGAPPSGGAASGPDRPRRDYRKPIDRISVPLLTGPVARGAAFAIELGRALARGLRGETRHPDERR